jgi:hypothetical protein
MADTIRLGTPHVRVVRASEPDKALDIQTTNVDLVLWDRTRLKHKWPKFEDVPFLWLTFIAWAAARRSGAIGQDVTYEAWERDVLSVDSSDADDDSDAPFPEGVTGSPSGGDSPSD